LCDDRIWISISIEVGNSKRNRNSRPRDKLARRLENAITIA
jgi:hypothetical protein